MTGQPMTSVAETQAWRMRSWGRGMVAAVIVALLGTSARIAWLKTNPNEQLERAAGTHRSDARELAERGQILDRRGRVLATSLMARRVFVDPALIWEHGWERVRKAQKADPESQATADPFKDISLALGSILNRRPTEIEGELRRRAEDRYHIVAEGLTDAQVEEIRRLNLKGVGVESYHERT